jgi:multicomponent Na+:H+ antiporter subunit D
MGTIGATFYVLGIGILYLLTGTLNIADMAARLGPLAADQWRAVIVALAFITVGISLKLALFPLHVWLPNAYAYAPSFATAFLAGTATKVAVYLLIRFYYSVFDVAIDFTALRVNEILVVLAIAAMFATSFVAVFESNIKRMLAYSSIAQIGYIIFGIGLADQAGLTGSLVHLFNHAVMKTALFLAIGAAFLRTGTVQLNDLAGIGRRMPLTMVTFAVAGFGIIGVPGTAGFISKWYLALGALDKGWWILVFLIVGSSLIALVYVGRVLEVVWLREPAPALATASDPPLSMLLPLIVLGAATIWFGFSTEWTAGIASTAATALIGGVR